MLIISKLMTNGHLQVPPSYIILIFALTQSFQPQKIAMTKNEGLE